MKQDRALNVKKKLVGMSEILHEDGEMVLELGTDTFGYGVLAR